MAGYHIFQDETIAGLADEARRLGGVTGELTAAQMKEIFAGVTAGCSGGGDVLPKAETGAF